MRRHTHLSTVSSANWSKGAYTPGCNKEAMEKASEKALFTASMGHWIEEALGLAVNTSSQLKAEIFF